MNRGLYFPPGFSATAFAAAATNWLLLPTTKLSKVYFGLKLEDVSSVDASSCSVSSGSVSVSSLSAVPTTISTSVIAMWVWFYAPAILVL